MLQISVNNALLVDVTDSSSELPDDVMRLALRQLVHTLLVEVIKQVTTFHVFSHDVDLSIESELLNKWDHLGVSQADLHGGAFTDSVLQTQTLIEGF